jgi:hypothetical protein
MGKDSKAYMKNKQEQAADKIKDIAQEKLMAVKPKDVTKKSSGGMMGGGKKGYKLGQV